MVRIFTLDHTDGPVVHLTFSDEFEALEWIEKNSALAYAGSDFFVIEDGKDITRTIHRAKGKK